METHEEDAIDLFLTRRQAVHAILGSAATCASMTSCVSLGPVEAPVSELPIAKPRGTLTDPDLINTVVPWAMQMTEKELDTATVLCDLIMPADHRSPSASAVGVPAFLNEWVSAPYEKHEKDHALFKFGLAWLEEKSQKKWARPFRDLTEKRKRGFCDPIAYREPGVKPTEPDPLARPAKFFSRFRALTLGGYYTTQEGRDDLQFMGNVAMGEFPGPPPEVLAHLRLI
jgi:hypothetical protein